MSHSTGFGIQREREMPLASETETQMARLWAELLQREAVGPHDDYFALGGNSLLAVNLFARVEAQFGVKLPLTSIIEAPTVAQFARLLETQGSHNPVVLIREGDGKPPLFLVHDADGETVIYRSLAHPPGSGTRRVRAPALQQGQPSDPAHPHRRDGGLSRRQHPEDSAASPYLLGGLCAGGLIAFEMARQLERDGETVAMVALMDVPDVDAQERPLRVTRNRLTGFASTFEQGKGAPRSRRVAAVARTVLHKAGNLVRYLTESRVRMIRDRTRMALFRLHLKLGLELPAFLRDISVRTAYGHAKTRTGRRRRSGAS